MRLEFSVVDAVLTVESCEEVVTSVVEKGLKSVLEGLCQAVTGLPKDLLLDPFL